MNYKHIIERTDIPVVNKFEKVLIDFKSMDSFLAHRIFKIFPDSKIEIVHSNPYEKSIHRFTSKEVENSKKTLYIKTYDGVFLKRCPGFHQKKPIACCNYYVLNLGQQCPFDCSYCYLQSYLDTPATILYSNIENAFKELEALAIEHSHLPYRIGTGEIMDSLALEPISYQGRQLIQVFSKFPNWMLELKTKSTEIESFLHIEHSNNIIISWSLNPQQIIDSEEHGTASLKQRLEAARKCADQNYMVAFHLDPLLFHQQWKDNYAYVVKELTSSFSPSEVYSISMGTLRFTSEQRHIVRERFGMKSLISKAELFPSEEGKWRYDFYLRKQMFDFMIQLFKKHDPKWNITLCMETPESWISSFDHFPLQINELRSLFRPLPNIQDSPNEK